MNQSGDPHPHPVPGNPSLESGISDPPRHLWGTLLQLGPGLIIAGSIVGSGELIATTKTGAQSGIALLWLVIIGCLIKVFVQVELGRFTISHGQTTLTALNQVPGPRFIVNWIIWFWLAMMLTSVAQLGGIVGGVGQAMAISFPITGDYANAIAAPSEAEIKRYLKWQEQLSPAKLEDGTSELLTLSPANQQRIRNGQRIVGEKLSALGPRGTELVDRVQRGEKVEDPKRTWDASIWAGVAAVLTMALLFGGRYSLIQNISTVLVVGFTFITIGNVISLQQTQQWHISSSEIARGLSFGLPNSTEGINPLKTALAAFGIIGVGATELVAYPYWCLEKGYARFTGPNSPSQSWVTRARGWMRVMMCDAFLSMVIYTVATIAFFLMGVAVLYREGRDPDGMRMVSTLASAYVPVFGEYARWLFLIGAVAVLYSTFLVALAGHTRTYTDVLKVFGLMSRDNPRAHQLSISTFGIVLPMMCLVAFWSGINPVDAILLAGTMQAVMLPMLGFAAIYFRYTMTDSRIAPGRLWDLCLIISFLGLLVAGVWGGYDRIHELVSDYMKT